MNMALKLFRSFEMTLALTIGMTGFSAYAGRIVQGHGAHGLREAFGGGGRAAAAGRDALPAHDLDRFIRAFLSMRWGGRK